MERGPRWEWVKQRGARGESTEVGLDETEGRLGETKGGGSGVRCRSPVRCCAL